MQVGFDELNEVKGEATDRAASPSSTSNSTVGISSTSDSLSQVSVSSGSSHSDTQQSLEPNNSAHDEAQSDSKEGVCLQSICLHVITNDTGCVGVSLSRREYEHDRKKGNQVLSCITVVEIAHVFSKFLIERSPKTPFK